MTQFEMRQINKTKFFAVIAVWAIALAVGTYFLKQRMEISSESLMSPLLSMLIIGLGVMGGIYFLKSLVIRGRCKWLLEEAE
jgi:hypothetical protein